MDLSPLPPNTHAGLIAMNGTMPLAGRDYKQVCNEVIERYMDGEAMASIAKSYGLRSTERLYQLLVEHAESDWKKATTARALTRHENAIREMETAPDGLGVSRGREVAKTAQWELERVCRRIYGQDAPAVQINLHLGDVGQRIRDLEGELLGVLPNKEAE